jgi:hypothetical protein
MRQLLGNTFALVKGYSLGQQNHFQGNTRTQPFPREWMIILFLPWMKTIQNKDGNGKKFEHIIFHLMVNHCATPFAKKRIHKSYLTQFS